MDKPPPVNQNNTNPEQALPSWSQMIAHLNGEPSLAATLLQPGSRKVRKVSFESPEDKQDLRP